jgi:4-aminobutyrate aminotransferase/(S)-3-amino-2-methylpropionate transaminase
MGLTGKVIPYKKGFGPFTPEIYHAPFPAEYLGGTAEESLHALEALFKYDIEPARVAAIIIEPIQGEGGFYPAPAGFIGRLREVCDQHGIVLIADEIQSGYGRTGRMFAIEYEGVEPDMITLAKGIAGGYPIAAVSGRAEVMDAPDPGGLGGTYAASPLGCVAGLTVLDIIEREGLVDRAVEIGDRLKAGLAVISAQHPGRIGDIRGKGAMVAMELVHGGDAGRPDPDLTAQLVKRASEQGLLIISCGVRANVIRILVPLTIPFEHLDEGLDILAGVFEDCA